MVLINGGKYACEACIRGHRATSCSHTTRQLQPVRPKGRPSSQCDSCKAKRASGGFHGRCLCNGTEGSRKKKRNNDLERGPSWDSVSGIATPNSEPEQQSPGESSSRGRYSLEALMNPCQCKTTGICTCCKNESLSKGGNDGGTKQEVAAGISCCDGDSCCANESVKSILKATSVDATGKGGSCCSRSRQEKVPDSQTHLISLPQDISREDAEATLSPQCQCGDNCSCPGCLGERKNDTSTSLRQEVDKNDECPEKCSTCSACVFGLTRPSGIEVIDQWMEEDAQRKATIKDDPQGYLPKKKQKTALIHGSAAPRMNSAQVSHRPPLPPFATAGHFFSSHFLDPDRRAYFSKYAGPASDLKEDVNSTEDGAQGKNEKVEYGKRLVGESDEEWQIRHGFYYLTPDAIQIFDSTRKFKEERQRREDQEERERVNQSVKSRLSPAVSAELSELRQKALSARKSSSKVIST